MADPVGCLKQIAEVALKIKEAVETARQNKKDCLRIGRRVERARLSLSLCENNAELMKESAAIAALEALGEILGEALMLVTACQERSFMCLCWTAGKLSKQLSKVDQDISSIHSDATFAILAILFYLISEQNKDSAHPPPPSLERPLTPAPEPELCPLPPEPEPVPELWPPPLKPPKKDEPRPPPPKPELWPTPPEPPKREAPRPPPLEPELWLPVPDSARETLDQKPKYQPHARNPETDHPQPTGSPLHREPAPRRHANPQHQQHLDEGGYGSSHRSPYTRTAGAASPMQAANLARKASSECLVPLTPGMSRGKQGGRGYEAEDEVTVPAFGDWDDSNAASGEKYTGIFNRVRNDKLSPNSSVKQPPSSSGNQEHKVNQAEERNLLPEIGQVALVIKEAVQTVRQNKECIEIDKRVNSISALLSRFQNTKTMKDPEMSTQLEKLLKTFRHAHTLVTACQRRNITIISPAGRLSKQLREALDLTELTLDEMIAISVRCVGTV